MLPGDVTIRDRGGAEGGSYPKSSVRKFPGLLFYRVGLHPLTRTRIYVVPFRIGEARPRFAVCDKIAVRLLRLRKQGYGVAYPRGWLARFVELSK